LSDGQNNLLVNMSTHPSLAPMATTLKTDKSKNKQVREELTFLDVRQAARDGQKVFDEYVITGSLTPQRAGLLRLSR
jgi:hypothetical protein